MNPTKQNIVNLLQDKYLLENVTLKVVNDYTLQINIPCTRRNTECHSTFYITPNKIQNLIRDETGADLIINMIM